MLFGVDLKKADQPMVVLGEVMGNWEKWQKYSVSFGNIWKDEMEVVQMWLINKKN